MAAIAVVVFVALYFVNKLRTGETTCSGCVEGLPASLRREIDKAEKRWKDTQ